TDAGSRSPMLRSSGASRRIARERSSAPVSVRPKVSSRPVESATQKEDQRCLACERNRVPRVSATRGFYGGLGIGDWGDWWVKSPIPNPLAIHQCVFHPARSRFLR